MASKPLISLILCVKNGRTFLDAAIASVAQQSYRSFELIVQDGGSTDGTLELLRGLTSLPSVQIESSRDSGLGQAYNRALPRCRGDIIGTIDCDNVLEPEALTVVADYFSRRDLAAIYSPCNMIDEQGKVIYTFDPMAFDLLSLMRCDLVPPFSTGFFARKNCGDQLRFDNRFTKCQDYDLWLRLSHLRVEKVPVCLGGTRLSTESMSCRSELYDEFCAEKICAGAAPGSPEQPCQRRDGQTLCRRGVCLGGGVGLQH